MDNVVSFSQAGESRHDQQAKQEGGTGASGSMNETGFSAAYHCIGHPNGLLVMVMPCPEQFFWGIL